MRKFIMYNKDMIVEKVVTCKGVPVESNLTEIPIELKLQTGDKISIEDNIVSKVEEKKFLGLF